MTNAEKMEIQGMIDKAIEKGLVKAIKAIYKDKDKLAELIEDIGIGKAIEQGMKTETIDKNAFLNDLNSRIE